MSFLQELNLNTSFPTIFRAVLYITLKSLQVFDDPVLPLHPEAPPEAGLDK
jgi:hypothetical protein